ncbi:MAG: hypothetical protein AUH43_16905 [Acidobacteria bacterium 13_1_40CM_65_14]|nr:MAG: hypothetical protein AUH43_16905 [Acidobacteria bacterium 13_1_40CM_65_14]
MLRFVGPTDDHNMSHRFIVPDRPKADVVNTPGYQFCAAVEIFLFLFATHALANLPNLGID